MLTSPEHRHVATGALAILAQRLGPEVLSAKPPRCGGKALAFSGSCCLLPD